MDRAMRSFDRRPELCESIRPSYSSRCKASPRATSKGGGLVSDQKRSAFKAVNRIQATNVQGVPSQDAEPPMGTLSRFRFFKLRRHIIPPDSPLVGRFHSQIP